jgi:Heat induced stress protein YflT domain
MQESHTPAGSTGTRRVYGGLYNDPAAAERGIRRFRDSGYEGERIGIISRDREEAKDVAEDTGASAATGAATGAVAGGLLGGLTGLLIGIGALAIPGIGPVVAGGALASAFGIGGGTAVAGAGIGAGVGAVGGGLVGALTNLGFEKDEAEYYDTGVRNGRTLVTIHDDDGRSESIFDETGAERYRRPSAPGTSSRAL